ncbi:MAG: TetR/AcrR family transcriptional regulator [Litorilituus sp.]|nr:TetR/AcrR family transcriptional regulator [Litorilituus sp.]
MTNGHKTTTGLGMTDFFAERLGLVMTETRKEREFRLREKEILDTAISLFNQYGLDKVTVADIAKATDIGKGTIYKHFVSKDVILARIANDFSLTVLKDVKAIDATKSCTCQMRDMFEFSFKAHVQCPLMSEISRLYHQPSFLERLPQESQRFCMDIEQEYFVILNRICEKGKQNNELPNLPVDELILGAHATYLGALEMLQSQNHKCFTNTPQISQQRFVDIIINYTMNGLFGQSFNNLQSASGENHE